jgi:hypothetical protein
VKEAAIKATAVRDSDKINNNFLEMHFTNIPDKNAPNANPVNIPLTAYPIVESDKPHSSSRIDSIREILIRPAPSTIVTDPAPITVNQA